MFKRLMLITLLIAQANLSFGASCLKNFQKWCCCSKSATNATPPTARIEDSGLAIGAASGTSHDLEFAELDQKIKLVKEQIKEATQSLQESHLFDLTRQEKEIEDAMSRAEIGLLLPYVNHLEAQRNALVAASSVRPTVDTFLPEVSSPVLWSTRAGIYSVRSVAATPGANLDTARATVDSTTTHIEGTGLYTVRHDSEKYDRNKAIMAYGRYQIARAAANE